jgi:Flp pilus assembly protein TadB
VVIKNEQTRETGNIGYTRRRKTKQKQTRETGNIVYTRRRKTKQNTIQRNWQHRVHKTKKNNTKTIQRNWQHRVHKTKKNKTKHISLVCFCFVFLRLVYPMLPVSLVCSFLITTSVSLTFCFYYLSTKMYKYRY